MLAKFSILTYDLILILISSLTIQVYSASSDLCPLVGDNYNSTISLYVNTSTDITQSSCSQYFEVEINSTLAQQEYLFFELIFSTLPDSPKFLPLLMARMNSLPSYTLGVSLADYVDTNAWKNRKSYHSIAIDIKNMTSGDKIYFGLYQSALSTANYVKFSVDYEIRLSTSSVYPCPQACSGHGFCNLEYKQCFCNADYFDVDCSVKATKIVLKEAAQLNINPNTWGYFYFSIQGFSDNMEIDLKKDTGILDYSFLFDEKLIYSLPNSFDSDGKYHLPLSQIQGNLVVEDDNVAMHLNDVLLVGAYNNYTTPITAGVTIKTYDDSSVIRTVSMYLMIAISVVLALAWLLVTVLRYKSHTQMETLLRNYQTEREQDKVLNKKDINKYFPRAKFQELRSGFNQNMCSVCLEDFEGESNCRQLYCEHIYHGECIEAWLAQHYNCPNCKKDMTKLAIEEALRQKAKQERAKLIAENGDEKRIQTEADILKRPQVEEGKEIHPIKAGIVPSRPNEEAKVEDNAEENASPEQTNLLRSSSVGPSGTTDFQVIAAKSIFVQSKLGGEKDNQSNHDSGFKEISVNGYDDSLSKSEFHGRAQNLKKSTYQSYQKKESSNLEAEVQAISLEG